MLTGIRSFTSLPAGISTSLALDFNNRPHIAAGLVVNNQAALTYGTDPGSGSVAARFVVSTNAVLDDGDTLVGRPRNVGAIGPGKSKMVNFSQVFPGTVPGPYLFSVLDSAEKNVENYETINNVSALIP